MRKLLIMLLALCLGFSCCLAEEADNPAASGDAQIPSLWEDGAVHRIERKTFPLYIAALENVWPEEFPVYLVDGANDLPYLDLRDFARLLGSFLSGKDSAGEDGGVTVTVDEEHQLVSYWRKTSNLIGFDFAEKHIVWTDYLAFNQADGALYLNMLRGFKFFDNEGKPVLLQVGNTRERHGRAVILDLKEYGIPMLAQDGLYLVPAQTLAAFCLGTESISVYFNQQCLIVTSPQLMGSLADAARVVGSLQDEIKALDQMDLSPEEMQARIDELVARMQEELNKPSIGTLYMAGPKVERSPSLADYGLRELCMELDCLYGLRDAHDASGGFMRYFSETGLFSGLISLDPQKADQAVWRLVNYWLDDGHSTFYNHSYLIDQIEAEETGFSKAGTLALRQSLAVMRAQYPEAVPGYYETGDTAFLTLDNFTAPAEADLYAVDTDSLTLGDTFSQVIRAHRQITREGSPIRNVVLDLSQNIGGAAPAAIYLISWMLGDAQLSVKDTFSGAESTVTYRADVNLDRVFDEQDTLAGRGLRLFCLTSPVSFSCGNLVPWSFKENGSVKLMGSVTGGGSCTVWPMSTAWGTSFAISGPYRLSFLKNGAYYDVDRGVEPDYVISQFEHYYDREALAAYVDTLY